MGISKLITTPQTVIRPFNVKLLLAVFCSL